MQYDSSNISRENFEDIIAFSANAILGLDKDKNIILFNAAAQNLFGYSEEEIIGKPLTILLPKGTRKKHDKYVEEFEKTPMRARIMSNRSTVHGITKSKSLVSLDISIQKHPKGGKLRYSAVIRNMTAFFQTLEILERSEARLSRAQKIAQIGHWEWDISTDTLFWSDEIYRIFGREKHDYEVSYDNFLNAIHPGDRDSVANLVQLCLEQKKPYAIIHRVLCPNGEEKVVREKAELFFDADGNVVRMDGTVQDISKSWEREAELRKTREEADAANIAKSQFLAIMSHELRTPLNAIIGLSTMMHEEILGPIVPSKYMEYIEDIRDSGYDLLSHINNILDISNVDMKKVDTQIIKVDSRNLIEACIHMVKRLSFIKDIRATIDIDETLDYIYVDPALCKKIPANLLSNAIKFSHQGGEVRIRLQPDKRSEHIVLSIQDFGVGFDHETVDDLFKPFTQVDMNFSRKYEGAGLGLSIVKSLTEAQGGRVEFESEVGEGTVVKVILPSKRPDDPLWI